MTEGSLDGLKTRFARARRHRPNDPSDANPRFREVIAQAGGRIEIWAATPEQDNSAKVLEAAMSEGC